MQALEDVRNFFFATIWPPGMLPIEFFGVTRTQCAPVRVACNKNKQEITKERRIIITKLLNTEKIKKIAQQKC